MQDYLKLLFVSPFLKKNFLPTGNSLQKHAPHKGYGKLKLKLVTCIVCIICEQQVKANWFYFLSIPEVHGTSILLIIARYLPSYSHILGVTGSKIRIY